MAKNKPEKPFIKGDPESIERARKGGQNRKGYRSLKTIMKEILASGEIDPKQFVKAQMIHAMKGNSGMAKIMWEYHDGKVKEELEVSNSQPTTIAVEFIEKADTNDKKP